MAGIWLWATVKLPSPLHLRIFPCPPPCWGTRSPSLVRPATTTASTRSPSTSGGWGRGAPDWSRPPRTLLPTSRSWTTKEARVSLLHWVSFGLGITLALVKPILRSIWALYPSIPITLNLSWFFRKSDPCNDLHFRPVWLNLVFAHCSPIAVSVMSRSLMKRWCNKLQLPNLQRILHSSRQENSPVTISRAGQISSSYAKKFNGDSTKLREIFYFLIPPHPLE